MRQEIEALRKELHAFPEVSGEEKGTAAILEKFIQKHHPTRIIKNIGNHGMAAVYTFDDEGPTIVIRCELDALPIEEVNIFQHRSKTIGVSHKCGHDGHMAIVAGLIFMIKEQDFKQGKIVLLFQPAEETGEGAFQVINDSRFKALQPDYIFALHNIPGELAHTIIPVRHNFSPSVQSLAIHLTGKEAHASEPENGINPAEALGMIISKLNDFNVTDISSENFTLTTPIYIKMGQKAYGISAGAGELHYTLRSWTEDNMNTLKTNILHMLKRICGEHNLSYKIEWFDYFPASINNDFCNDIIATAAARNNLNIAFRESPFKFGEDFGWFTKNYKAAMFGVGSGIKTPALHHAEYDFPDELLTTGIHMFTTIIALLLSKNYVKN